MTDATDRARRLLTTEAADHLADLLAITEGFHKAMDDAAFVGLCLTLISARERIAAEATAAAIATATKRGSLYHGGRNYDVRPA